MARAWSRLRCARGTSPTRILEWLEVREIRVRVGRPGHRAARAAVVDQSGRPADGARARTRAALCAALGARTVFPGTEAARCARPTCSRVTPSKRRRKKSPRWSWRVRCSRPSAVRAAGGQMPVLRVSFAKILELCVKPMWLWARFGPRRADRSATRHDHEARLHAHAPVCDARRGGPAAVPARCGSPSRRGRGCCRRTSITGPMHFQLV